MVKKLLFLVMLLLLSSFVSAGVVVTDLGNVSLNGAVTTNGLAITNGGWVSADDCSGCRYSYNASFQNGSIGIASTGSDIDTVRNNTGRALSEATMVFYMKMNSTLNSGQIACIGWGKNSRDWCFGATDTNTYCGTTSDNFSFYHASGTWFCPKTTVALDNNWHKFLIVANTTGVFAYENSFANPIGNFTNFPLLSRDIGNITIHGYSEGTGQGILVDDLYYCEGKEDCSLLSPPTISWQYPNGTYNETYNTNSWKYFVNFTTDLNCSLGYGLNNSNYILNYTNGTVFSYYNPTIPSEGSHTLKANCSNTAGTATSYATFIIDTSTPTASANITSGTYIKVGTNITINYTFTDNLLLWGYNISINGNTLNFTKNIQKDRESIKLWNNSWVWEKANNISLVVYDAHTALETTIKDSDVSKVGDSLKVGSTLATSLNPLDKITYVKAVDRFTFCYYLKAPSNEIQIRMPSDCFYQNREDLYTSWLVCPAERQWWDFVNKDYVTSFKDGVVTSRTKDGKLVDKFCYNSVGSLNENSANYTLYGFNDSISGNANVFEYSNQTFILRIDSYNLSFVSYANLTYNNTIYPVISQTNGSNYRNLSVSILVPSVSAHTNITWWFNYSINGVNYQTALRNQSVYDFAISNCTAGGVKILNLTLKDEANKLKLNNSLSTIEIDLDITNGVNIFNYYKSVVNNFLDVCLPINLSSNYTIDFTAGYISTDSTGYVQEFYYLDDGVLSSSCSFNNHTSCDISLYDLLSADSTTFLFEYTDENGLSVDDAIIHTFRKYIGEGIFYEVERSRQDDNGETHIHLVEEDVIYYFMVTQYGNVVYISDEYNAKCISTPCQIELSSSLSFSEFPTDWDSLDGVQYSIDIDKSTRITTINFVSDESILFNASLYKYNNNVATLVNRSNATGTSGSLALFAPNTYGNTTFFVVLYKNNTFLNSDWVDLNPSARDYFGSSGLILSSLIVMAVGLIALSEGVILIIGICLAVFLCFIMFMLELSWLALMSLICAGGILIWKMVRK